MDRLLANRRGAGKAACGPPRPGICGPSTRRPPMTTTTTPDTRPQTVKRWGGLLLAAVIWWVLYLANQPFWDWLVGRVIGLDLTSRLGSGVQFFFLDTVKIALLLAGIIFIVTVLRSFMSVERTRALLGGKREGIGNILAASLGVVTPFCSCSAVPAFIGFVASGIPLGVTMSFLIASPLVNEVAIALLLGLFGIGPTLLYVGCLLYTSDAADDLLCVD